MGTLAFVCPATGKSVITDLEIDTSSYSSILKNRLSQMRCTQCGGIHLDIVKPSLLPQSA